MESTPAESSRTSEHFDQFARTLASSGAREALAYVLRLSDYRFIGIFRFKDGKATAAIHYDREDPSVLFSAEVPDTATYCCYVRDTQGVFTTADSLADPRLTEHPAREAVRTYCGVPVLAPDGRLLGTLCHYDLVPRDPARLDTELLIQVAAALEQGDHVPAYPERV